MRQILMHVVRDPHRTPRSAARHAERANRLLLSPEHRRLPAHPPQPQPAIMPLQLGLHPNNHPFIMGEDPFVLPPPPPSLPHGPSPATVRRQLEDLHAQAAAAAANLVPQGRQRRRRRQLAQDPPLPAPEQPPPPVDLHAQAAAAAAELIPPQHRRGQRRRQQDPPLPAPAHPPPPVDQPQRRRGRQLQPDAPEVIYPFSVQIFCL